MKKAITLLLVITLSNTSFSQANDVEALLYNVSIGGVFGTIGAVINKKPHEKTGKIIIKGFTQGFLGGYLTFESKRVLRLAQENEDWKLIWAAKLLNAGGTSIKENAALNENFWNKWYLNIGFNRIEFETKNKLKVNYKVMPVALIYTTIAFTQAKFNMNLALKTGEFVFKSNDYRLYEGETAALGVTYPGFFVLRDDINSYKIIIHEIVHIYQSNDYLVLNSFYVKPIKKIENKLSLFKKVNKYLYFDLHYLPLRAAYVIESNTAKSYYDNFFEHEAGYFSNTLN